MIRDVLGDIDYDDRGTGPAVVLIPGSCSTGAAWRPIVSALGGQLRCITTSLLGYGGTAERRHASDMAMAHETDIVEAVIRRAAAPVHLVGHSFGGLVALAVAMRRRVPLASLTVLEAPAVELLRHSNEDQPYRAEFLAMTDAYFAAYDSGESQSIKRMIDFYGGPGTFQSWPERVRAYAIETTAVNIRDWSTGFGFPLTPERLSYVSLPSLVVWGANSHPAARRANLRVSEALKNTKFGSNAAEIVGAAHFMITTHADEIASLVARHIDHVERTTADGHHL